MLERASYGPRATAKMKLAKSTPVRRPVAALDSPAAFVSGKHDDNHPLQKKYNDPTTGTE